MLAKRARPTGHHAFRDAERSGAPPQHRLHGKRQLTFHSHNATFPGCRGSRCPRRLLAIFLPFQQMPVLIRKQSPAATIATERWRKKQPDRLTLAIDGGTRSTSISQGAAVSADCFQSAIVASERAHCFQRRRYPKPLLSLEGDKLEITSKGNSATCRCDHNHHSVPITSLIGTATAAAASTVSDLSRMFKPTGNAARWRRRTFRSEPGFRNRYIQFMAARLEALPVNSS